MGKNYGRLDSGLVRKSNGKNGGSQRQLNLFLFLLISFQPDIPITRPKEIILFDE
jgi:hypothetical protein